MSFCTWTPSEVREYVLVNRGRDRRRRPPVREELRRRWSQRSTSRLALTPEELERRRARNLEAVRRYRLRHPAARPRGRPRKQAPRQENLDA